MQCQVCGNITNNLRTKTHVIPRCLILQTKIQGRNVSVSNNKVKRRNIKDLVVKLLWCDPCEMRFSREDSFSKKFFVDQSFFIAKRTVKTPLMEIQVDVFDPVATEELRIFLLGIFVRYQVYLESQGKDILATHRLAFFNEYLSRGRQYNLRGFRYHDLSILGYPAKEDHDGIQSVFCLILGFRFWFELKRTVFAVTDDGSNLCDDKDLNFINISIHDSGMKPGLLKMLHLPEV
jgi:hypothetical protein